MLNTHQKLAVCAAHFASGGGAGDFDTFAAWAQAQGQAVELKRLLTALDHLPLVRRVSRFRDVDPVEPALVLDGDTVMLDGTPIGRLLKWHRAALPQETQARIAYDSLIDRFLAHLAATRKTVALSVNDLAVWAFAPSNADTDLATAWDEFVKQDESQDTRKHDENPRKSYCRVPFFSLLRAM